MTPSTQPLPPARLTVGVAHGGAEVIVVQGLYWVGGAIDCTGYHFVGCRFDGCVLHGVINTTDCLINPGVTQ